MKSIISVKYNERKNVWVYGTYMGEFTYSVIHSEWTVYALKKSDKWEEQSEWMKGLVTP